mmetsp:Transcript_55213/g.147855  ORF Transcript_55213/g.147855 Transcript_55213/m.147855 type:complete len:203 (-) Transcript_55213:98-706(-)
MGDWSEARLEALRALFLKRGEVHAEASAEKRELSHDGALPDGLQMPAPLRSMLKLGAKWNFTKGSCDVFVCNVYAVAPADTEIFGDDDLRAEWSKDHGGEESCAGKDWALVCVTSEFHFYFVNLRTDSPNFGSTRHIVNNCDEEDAFTSPPFERFLDVIEAWAKASAAKEPSPGEDEAEIEYDTLDKFLPAKRQKVEKAAEE